MKATTIGTLGMVLALALFPGGNAFAAAGNLDTNFDPGSGANNKVYVVHTQSDGHFLVGGMFTSYDGTPRTRLARVMPDGSLDTSFDPGAGANDMVQVFLVQPDGSIVVGGKFSWFAGGLVGRLARVTADGTLDMTFNAGGTGFGSGTVESVIGLSSGKLLVGGSFTTYNGMTVNRLARLNADGGLDETFATGSGPNNLVKGALELPDGRIVVVGSFTAFDGRNYGRVACLGADGSLDTRFVNPDASGTVYAVALQTVGGTDKILIGGSFARVGNPDHVTLKVARLNLDGTPDTGFQNPGVNSDVYLLAVQPDQKVVIGGLFTAVGGEMHNRLARLTEDGTVDVTFNSGTGANAAVRAFDIDPQGYWLVGGDFTDYDGTSRNHIMRVVNDLEVAATIVAQPENVTVAEGSTAIFTAEASGRPPLTYRWYADGVPLVDGGDVSGSVTAMLSVANADDADEAAYHVTVQANNTSDPVASSAVTLTVNPNVPPTMESAASMMVGEDPGPQSVTLTGISEGAAYETSQTLTITATSDNPSVVPDPVIAFTEGAAIAELTFTPGLNANGLATITVSVVDDGLADTTTVRTFNVTVRAANDAPTVAGVPATRTVNEDTPMVIGGVTVGDVDNATLQVTVQAGHGQVAITPANPAGVTFSDSDGSDGTIVFSGTLADLNAALAGSIQHTPDAEYFGADTLTVAAADLAAANPQTTQATLAITVNAVNDAPTVTLAQTDFFHPNENPGSKAVGRFTTFSPGPVNEAGQRAAAFILVAENPALFSVPPTIDVNGTLRYTVASDTSGYSEVRVSVRDDGGTANGGVDTSSAATFAVAVGSQNVPPSFDLMASDTVPEDSGLRTVPGFVTNIVPGPADESAQLVSFSTATATPGHFAVAPAMAVDGTLTYTPAPDAEGTATVTVTATDDGLPAASRSHDFTVTITPVDDAPQLVLPGGPVDFVPEGPPVLLDPTAMVSDVDATAFKAGGRIDVTNAPGGLPGDFIAVEHEGTGPGQIGVVGRFLYHEGRDLGFMQTGRGDTGENGKALRIIITSDEGTVSVMRALLRRLNFENTSAVPPAAPREFEVTVTDAGGLKATATTIVRIPGVEAEIIAPPTDVTALAGSTATLTVVADGSPLLTYRWMRNGVDVPGAVSATLTLSPVRLADAGDYTVEVSNAGGSETSATPAGLTVLRNTAPDFAFVGGENAITNLIAWGDNAAGQASVPPGLLNPAYVAAGGAHSIAIQESWTAVGWGDNSHGQTAFPHDLDVVWWVAGGAGHSLLLHGNDGQITAFGDNSSGQATVPAGLDYAFGVYAGAHHSLARIIDGSLVAWGDNTYGQTDVPSIEIPTPPGGIPMPPQFWYGAAAGDRHSVGYHSGGPVLAWGDNTFGQTNVPAEAHGGVSAVVAGGHHNLLLKRDGTLVAWGDLAEIPAGLAGQVQTIAAGHDFNLALKTDGTVVAWGDNSFGQTDVPAGLSDVVGIAAGDRHALAIYTTRAPGPVLSVVEDSGAYSLDPFVVNITKGAQPIEDSQSPTFYVTTGSPGLFASGPEISPAGALTFEPAPNAHGTATVTVHLSDDGGTTDGGVDMSSPQTFIITIGGVNDPPVVTLAANDLTVLEDSGAFPAGGGFASFSPGPADEVGQSLVGYAVTADPATMFSVQPALDMSGDLTFTPAANANGVATITVVTQDDGNTVNNGVDRSTNTFTITVTPVNDAPTFALRSVGEVVAWGWNDNGQATVPTDLTSVTAVAAGWYHSLALRFDGSVAAWGANWQGESDPPAAVQNGVTAIAGGNTFSLALKADGSVFAWGDDVDAVNLVPPALTDAVAIAAGERHGLALRSDGTVIGWGENSYGQTNVPVGLNNVVAIAAGSGSSLALRSDGTAVIWGLDWDVGRLTVLNDLIAIDARDERVLGLRSDGSIAGDWWVDPAVNAIAIASGADHALALRADGTLTMSGGGEFDNAGVIPPAAASGVRAVAAGESHSLALVSGAATRLVVLPDSGSQTVAGFVMSRSAGPAGESGQVGLQVDNDNNSLFSAQPQIDANGTLTFTSASGMNGAALVTVVALDDGGTANGGIDSSAPQSFVIEVGNVNQPPTFDLTARDSVLEDSGPRTVAGFASNIGPGSPSEAGQAVSFAVTADAGWLFSVPPTIAADGTLGYTPAPDVFGSSSVAVVVTDDGPPVGGSQPTTLKTFQIEIRGVNEAPSFALNLDVGAQITGWGRRELVDPPAEAFSGVIDIDTVWEHSLALKTDGTVVAWGNNSEGQATVPVGLNGVVAIASEQSYSMALKDDGTVVTWGQIDFGAMPAGFTDLVAIDAGWQHSLGLKRDGTVVGWGDEGTPPAGLSNVVGIAAGVYHSVAVKSDGTVVTWGSGGAGLLDVPVEATGVIAVAAADYHTLALRDDGTVVAWGNGSDGQAVVPPGLGAVVALSAGPRTSVALRSDGTVVAWGLNDSGQANSPGGLAGVVDVAAGHQHTLALRGADIVVVAEDSGPQSTSGFATGIQPGPGNEIVQAVQFIVSTDNPTLFATAPAIDAAGTLTYTTTADAVGSAVVTVIARDDGGTADGGVDSSAPQTFKISVAAVNDPPDLVLQGIPATVSFFNDPAYVSASQLIDGSALLTSLGANVVPFVDFETAVIASPVIVVPALNDTLSPAMDAGIRAALSNYVHTGGVMITMANVVGNSYGFVLENEIFGYSLIPSVALSPSIMTTAAIGTPFADDLPVIWPSLIAADLGFSPSSLPANAAMIYQATEFGADEATVVLFHVGAGRVVHLGADFVDDAIWTGENSWLPVLASAITPTTLDMEVLENAGAQTIAGFASPTDGGPRNEPGQSVTYLVSNDNNSLFSMQPGITAGGDLTYTVAANTAGTATVTVRAMDDGGTGNGGNDTSAEQTFTITVRPVNDAPTFNLMPAGRVIAWGENSYGQATVPSEAMGGVKAVACGWYHSLALTDDGSVVGWGSNWAGESDVPLAAQSGVTAVSAGNTFSLALKDDGTVVGWGENSEGQATPPAGLTDVTAIAAGDNFSLALKSDGTVVGWGRSSGGQLDVPSGLNDVVAIAAGGGNSLALKSDGTVVGWGFDIGRFEGFDDLVAVDTMDERILGLRSDGTLEGYWYGGPPVTNVWKIAVGADHALALRNDGTVVMRGGGPFDDAGEVPLYARSGVIAIAAGESHSLALVRGVSPELTISEDSGAIAITNAAYNVSAGPPDESTQIITFSVDNDNPDLFSVAPWMDADGTLSFTARAETSGSANVTVHARDDGGTADSGSDTAAPQSFTLEVLPVNDPPRLGLQMLPDTVAVFNDTTDGWPQFLAASNRFEEIGVTVASFTDFNQVAGEVDVIVIPKLREVLVPSLDAMTISAISNHVQHGGILLTMGNAGISEDTMLNTLFDYSLVHGPNTRGGTRTDAVFGTPFADDPVRPWGVTFMQGWKRDSLPSTAQVLYEEDRTEVPPGDPSRQASVIVFPVGTGRAVFFVADFFSDQQWTGERSWSPILASAITPVSLEVEVPRNHGAMTVAAFASPTTTGATNEGGQMLTFLVSDDNNGLFSVPPTIAPNGDLTFATAVDTSGTATVTARAKDDGGTANGGVDVSAEQIFTITVQSTRLFFAGIPSARPGFAAVATVGADLSGEENAIGFTLSFDPAVLTFTGAALNPDVTVLTPLLSVNDAAAASGRVGLALALPAGTTFPAAGVRQLIDVAFEVASGASEGVRALSFTDDLTPREVTDINASVMPYIGYADGGVTVTLGTHEGDVSPRPFGDGVLSITDAIQIGRFVTGLDSPMDSGEFQRADSAPLATGGDGRLSVADWAQALRFAAGLDPVPGIAGPGGGTPGPASLPSWVGAPPSRSRAIASLNNRAVSLKGVLIAGQAGVVSIVTDAQGDEAGIGLTLGYDPTVIGFESASKGDGLNGATLLVNQSQTASGRLGIILAAPPGQAVPAGRQVLVDVVFRVAADSPATTSVTILNDGPVVPELSAVDARVLPVNFVGAGFPIQLPPGFRALEMATQPDGTRSLVFGNADGSPVTAGQLASLEVRVTSDVVSGSWSRLENALELVDGKVRILDPEAAGKPMRFYQVSLIPSSGIVQ